MERIRRFTELPIALGFGISNAEHVRAVGEFADAAVVGSAVVAADREDAASRCAPKRSENLLRGCAAGQRVAPIYDGWGFDARFLLSKLAAPCHYFAG